MNPTVNSSKIEKRGILKLHYEDFINDMTEEQYNIWYGVEATAKQKEVADRIREEVTEDDATPDLTPRENRFISFIKSIFRRK